jgi:NAD-dependent SIR2 family protein deacetylase
VTSDALAARFEIMRLMQAIGAIAGSECCRGAGTTTFQVLDRNGRPTGQEVHKCDACGRELG